MPDYPSQDERYARLCQLRKMTKNRLIVMYKQGVRTPGGGTSRYIGGMYPIERWSKDDIVSSIISIEYPATLPID